jgi:hypothetical protein
LSRWCAAAAAASVTRFGEFSPFGRLFTLDSFMKITGLATYSENFFPSVKVAYSFWPNSVWASFCVNFSPANLVTLAATALVSLPTRKHTHDSISDER